ncbi:MAG: chloride channel protein, partial [Boseongicola sp. SB0670_bin_30]|nr:chloride channel protein [Boseongicola sp. SB0670_bin_30]
MDAPRLGPIGDLYARLAAKARDALRVVREDGPGQVQFWFIALLVGSAAGAAAVLFRLGINLLQATLYGTDDPRLMHSFAETLPWYMIVLIPVCGGLVVGIILDRFTADGRARSVAE